MGKQRRGQVTIFIIIGVVIVAAVLAFFLLRGSFSVSKVPASLEPVYSSFLECVEQDALTGASILESQGGYIELPEFEPGSEYMPFSSQLNFAGNPIPYWYYVSGNNIEREQVPSLDDMEAQLEEFIESRVRKCEFQSYRNQGFEISLGEPDASVNIRERTIKVKLDLGFGIGRGNESVFVDAHEVEADSGLGELYTSAREVYEEQQNTLFLEGYGVDVLRSYAPVDGIEITCSPLTWSAENVVNDLQEAIELNTLALNENPDKYYDLDLPVKHKVRFFNSKQWPSTFEISPNEGNFLVANPVGNQPGLGAMGFCYVAYHFVYDTKYPVLVQIYDEKNPGEVFQFPLAVVIEGNQPREPTNAEATKGPELELCRFKNTPLKVSVYDVNLNPVDSRVSYECFGQSCNIGQTKNGVLEEDFPQCVNGYVLVDADGFERGKYLFTTVNSGSIEVILDKIYDKFVNLRVDNEEFSGNAVVVFTSDKRSETLVYPEDRIAELSEGEYEVRVQVYEEGEISLGSKNVEQCIDVPRGGLLGSVGLVKERCFDIEVPEQTLSPVLVGGGSVEIYLSESDLSGGKTLEISVSSFSKPETIEGVQINSILLDNSKAEVSFV